MLSANLAIAQAKKPAESPGLSEEHRLKLDDIVQRMVANGERDEDIQFVVNDFKQKYRGRAPQKPQASAGIGAEVAPEQKPQYAPPGKRWYAQTDPKTRRVTYYLGPTPAEGIAQREREAQELRDPMLAARRANELAANVSKKLGPLNIVAQTQGIQSAPGIGKFVPLPSDLVAGMATAPAHIAADAYILGNPEASPLDRLGAAANLVMWVAPAEAMTGTVIRALGRRFPKLGGTLEKLGMSLRSQDREGVRRALYEAEKQGVPAPDILKALKDRQSLGVKGSTVLPEPRSTRGTSTKTEAVTVTGYRNNAPGGVQPGTGTFYSNSEATAKAYQAEKGGDVVKESLTFNKPLKLWGGQKAVIENLEHLPFSPEAKKRILAAWNNSDGEKGFGLVDAAIARAAKEKGYDGIIYDDGRWGSEYVDLRQPTRGVSEDLETSRGALNRNVEAKELAPIPTDTQKAAFIRQFNADDIDVLADDTRKMDALGDALGYGRATNLEEAEGLREALEQWRQVDELKAHVDEDLRDYLPELVSLTRARIGKEKAGMIPVYYKNGKWTVLKNSRKLFVSTDAFPDNIRRELALRSMENIRTEARFMTPEAYTSWRTRGDNIVNYLRTVEEIVTKEQHLDDMVPGEIHKYSVVPRTAVVEWVKDIKFALSLEKKQAAARSLRLSDEEFEQVVRHYTEERPEPVSPVGEGKADADLGGFGQGAERPAGQAKTGVALPAFEPPGGPPIPPVRQGPPPAPKDKTLFDRYKFTRMLSEEGQNTADSVFAQTSAPVIKIADMQKAATDFAQGLTPADLGKLKAGRSFEEVGGLLSIGDRAADDAAKLRAKAMAPGLSADEIAKFEKKADELDLLASEAYEKAAPGISGAGKVLRFIQERPNTNPFSEDYLLRLANREARRSGMDGADQVSVTKIRKIASEARAKQARLDNLESKSELSGAAGGSKPRTSIDYGSSNKVFTKDKYAADADVIKKKMAQVSFNPFADFELITALTRAVAYHAEAGTRAVPELYKIVKELVGDKVGDADIYKIIRQGVARWAQIENQGRSFGESVQVRGKHGVQSPEIATLRKQIDEARMEIAATIANLRKPGFWERQRIRLRAFRLSNPVARVYDLLGNTVTTAARQVGSEGREGLDTLLFPRLRRKEGAANLGWSFGRAKMVGEKAASRWGQEFLNSMRIGDPRVLRKFEIFRELPEGPADTFWKKIAAANPIGNKALNRVARFAGTTDIPFKDTAFRGTLAELAEGRASLELKGKPREQIVARANEIFKKALDGDENFAELLITAENEASQAVFMGDNTFTRWLQRGDASIVRDHGDAGHALLLLRDIAIPFPRIFSNIQGYSTDLLFGSIKAANRARVLKGANEMFTLAERRHINRLVERNLFGAALVSIGGFLYHKGIFKPEINEKGGFLDFGEYEQTGGPMMGLIYGAALNAIGEANVTDKQREKLLWNTMVNVFGNQPAVSGPKQFFQSLQNPEAFGKYSGAKLSSAFIPGIIREWARRQDQFKDKGTVLGMRRPEVKTFGDAVKSNLPFARETLATKG